MSQSKMKHGILPAMAFCLMALSGGMASCSSESEAEVDFAKTTIHRSAPLTKDAGSPACNININVAYAEGTDSVAVKINNTIENMLFDMQGIGLKQAADSFASSYTRNYVSYLTPFYREDRNDPSKRSWYEYWYKIDTEASHEKPGLIAYMVTKEYYEGGSHSIKIQTATNFDCSTGDAVKLSDVFVPGYEQHLTDVLLRLLKEKTGATDINSLRDKGYLYSSDMFVSANFILGQDAITFIYNPYEIAPYELGATELTVDYDDIDNLLKK